MMLPRCVRCYPGKRTRRLSMIVLRIWRALAETQFGFDRTMASAQRDGNAIRGDDGHIALGHEDAR